MQLSNVKTRPRSLPRSLVLFDIDGTLLETHGAGRRCFERALEKAFGWGRDAAGIRFSGATDLDLLQQLARRRNHTLTDGEVEIFFGLLAELLIPELAAEPPHVYPGVRELLAHLSSHPDVQLGLVTGNIETCARIKLEAAGLHGHFTLGAFGHEHADRRDIARLALQRLDPEGAGGPRFLIGDTPSDIAAAHAISAVAIAVATGIHEADKLREAGAHHVAHDLSDLAQLRTWMQLD